MLRGFLKRFIGLRFNGDYSWEQASKICGAGYQSDYIAQLAVNATQKAMAAEHLIVNQRSIRLLAALLQCDCSHVVDFGGALGGHYWKLRRHLPTLQRWTVVELPLLVNLGRQGFANGQLEFSTTIPTDGTVTLASSSLQYIENSASVVQQFNTDRVILDRVPTAERDRVTIQTVPYQKARYPARFFCVHTIFEEFGLNPILQWEVPEDIAWVDGRLHPYIGFLATRRPR